MAKLTLTDLTSAYSSITAINANNALIEAAVENTLSRDGSAPNSMNALLDMNSNRVINLPQGVAASDPVTVQQMQDFATADVLTVVPATNVTIADSGGYYTAIDAEGALQELPGLYESVALNEGASLIGIHDASLLYSGSTVEEALAEIRGNPTQSFRTALELATQAEVDAGIDNERAITPSTLANASSVPTVTNGSFTATTTGCTTVPSETVYWSKTVFDSTRSIVHLWAPTSLVGTSNSTGCTMTGIPAAISPTTTQTRFDTYITDDTGFVPSQGLIAVSGTVITFHAPDNDFGAGGGHLSSIGFTTSGFKGPGAGWQCSYIID